MKSVRRSGRRGESRAETEDSGRIGPRLGAQPQGVHAGSDPHWATLQTDGSGEAA